MSALLAGRYYRRGLEDLERGQAEDACQHFQAALTSFPGFCEARLGHARALLRLRDPVRAVQTLRAGLHHATRDEERTLLQEALGDALLQASDYIGAEQALAEARRHGAGLEGRGELHAQLARLRGRTGRFTEAFDELLQAAKLASLDR